ANVTGRDDPRIRSSGVELRERRVGRGNRHASSQPPGGEYQLVARIPDLRHPVGRAAYIITGDGPDADPGAGRAERTRTWMVAHNRGEQSDRGQRQLTAL